MQTFYTSGQYLVAYDVSAVAMQLAEHMAKSHDEEWPEGYRYEIFGGFPGFWGYGTKAGLVYARFVQQNKAVFDAEIEYLDFTLEFSEAVFRWTKIRQRELSLEEIETLAKELYEDTTCDTPVATDEPLVTAKKINPVFGKFWSLIERLWNPATAKQ